MLPGATQVSSVSHVQPGSRNPFKVGTNNETWFPAGGHPTEQRQRHKVFRQEGCSHTVDGEELSLHNHGVRCLEFPERSAILPSPSMSIRPWGSISQRNGPAASTVTVACSANTTMPSAGIDQRADPFDVAWATKAVGNLVHKVGGANNRVKQFELQL